MTIGFLNLVQAIHRSFLPDDALDSLIKPSQRGNRLLAGVNLQQPRIQAVSQAMLAGLPNPKASLSQSLQKKHANYSLSMPLTARIAKPPMT